MPSQHSRFSPSAAARWLACPGSLEGDEPNGPASEHAAEGTVAHTLAERCWLLGSGPEEYIGECWTADGYSIQITEEMTKAVQLYLDVLESQSEGSHVVVESRIEHSLLEGFGGTIDAAIPGVQRIVDLKYGSGIVVEAIENPQLACYALLFNDYFYEGHFVDTEVTIVQPRASHPDGPVRTWVISQDYLEDFYGRVKEVIDGHRAGELNAGDHCRFCPRAVNCPELYEKTLLMAKADFSADEMTPERAAEVLQLRTAVKAYLENVEKWTHGRMELGDQVPGYKLVDTYGQRRWAVDEETIVKKCRSRKIGKKQIYKSTLLSPAQLEKVAGKELVAELVERPHKGTTVVSDSDRRPAVSRTSAAEEFDGCASE